MLAKEVRVLYSIVYVCGQYFPFSLIIPPDTLPVHKQFDNVPQNLAVVDFHPPPSSRWTFQLSSSRAACVVERHDHIQSFPGGKCQCLHEQRHGGLDLCHADTADVCGGDCSKT